MYKPANVIEFVTTNVGATLTNVIMGFTYRKCNRHAQIQKIPQTYNFCRYTRV